MIEAICWDIGGVFSPRPVDAIARFGARHGVDPDELLAAVFGDYGTDGDHPWHRLERGELPLAEAWPQIEAGAVALGIEFSLADFFGSFAGDEHDRGVVTDTVLEFHALGVRMAVITNNVREFSQGEGGGWRSLIPIDTMTVVVDSSAVGMRKPNPAIFHHTLDELGVGAAAAVFVDDTPANVDAAREVGMHGVLCGADPAVAMAELRTVVAEGGGPPVSSR